MGKSTVIYVVGLSLLIAYGLLNINDNSVGSMDTFAEYTRRTMAHNIALTGANIGTQLLMRNPGYLGDLLNQPVGDRGWFDMRLNKTGDQATLVSVGRYVVPVDPDRPDGYLRDTVTAKFRRISFSEYGYFSEREQNGYMGVNDNSPPSTGSMWKVTGDSMFGYSHTNSKWNLGGRPYFHDKITATNAPSTMMYGGVYAPVFNAGYQWGITVNRPPANMAQLQATANAGNLLDPGGATLFNGKDVGLEFFSGGTVRVRIPYNTGSLKDTTLPVTSLTSNGIIGVNAGDVRVKGVYRGQITVAAFKGSSGVAARKGNVWIDGDLRANTNPRTNPSSPDLMGLVAHRMTYLTTTGIVRNATSNTWIDAAIYCHDGVFAAENYSTVPVSGRINLFGGTTMAASTSTGRITGGSLSNGFLKSFRHDPRFLTVAPPGFPTSEKYKLISWWEN